MNALAAAPTSGPATNDTAASGADHRKTLMDLLTQGLAGAVLAQAIARRPQLKLAALVGFCAGMLPDADILIRSASDPLLNIEFHRHFSHSLLFAPFGALLVALPVWLLTRRQHALSSLYLFALIAYASGGLLDAATSFGTVLLWPLSESRIAWNLIAVIDPLFSLILLGALLLSLYRHSMWPARIGVGLALLYLLLALVQRERAETLTLALAHSRNHEIERLEVKPTLGNILLWRSIYQADGYFHVDAIRVGLLRAPQIFPGAAIRRFSPDQLPGLNPDSLLAGDIARFTHLSDGYVALHPDRDDILGDVRYAMLPDSIEPLWGIRIDPARPDQHVSLHTFRRSDAATREEFFRLLRGSGSFE